MISIFRGPKFRPRQVISPSDAALMPAHLVGIPANIENCVTPGRFSNKEIGQLADLAKKYNSRMSGQFWQETLLTSQVDGPAITTTGAQTALQPQQKFTLPNGYFNLIGRQFKVQAMGRISCVVTTPGTARYDVRMGTVVMFDTAAMNLNVVAKTNLPFWFECVFTIRAIGNGTNANAFGFGTFTTEAVVGSPLSSAGGNGTLTSSGGGGLGATAIGAGFDSTAAQIVDFNFTQTVATGSMTVQQFSIASIF